MSHNDFQENYDFGVKKYHHLLDIFYKHYCYDARFVRLGDLAKSPFSNFLQRTLKTDTVIQTSVQVSYGVEEKVVGWPAHDQPHTAFFLETRSCTNKGHESRGWMATCKADLLLYAFEIKDVGLLIYLLDFPRLRHWFWEQYLPSLSRPAYGLSVMPDENRTEGRVVAITRVIKEVPTRCFLITFGEAFHEIKLDGRSDIPRLRSLFLAQASGSDPEHKGDQKRSTSQP